VSEPVHISKVLPGVFGDIKRRMDPGLAELWGGGECRRDATVFAARKLHNLLLLAECDELTESQRLSAMGSVCRCLRTFLAEEFGLCAKAKAKPVNVPPIGGKE
jgi:hypothetical protein